MGLRYLSYNQSFNVSMIVFHLYNCEFRCYFRPIYMCTNIRNTMLGEVLGGVHASVAARQLSHVHSLLPTTAASSRYCPWHLAQFDRYQAAAGQPSHSPSVLPKITAFVRLYPWHLGQLDRYRATLKQFQLDTSLLVLCVPVLGLALDGAGISSSNLRKYRMTLLSFSR